MDNLRFAAFVRAVNGAMTRRASLGALFVAGLAAPWGHFAVNDVSARKRRRKKKKKCKGNTRKCGKRCIPVTDCCSVADCGPNELCASGTCVCPSECCTDDECAANETCVSGICTCPAEQICEDVCCPAEEFCVGGVCQGAGTCQVGQNVCTGFSGCNGENTCDCLTRFVDDALICGNLSSCTNCDEDADCPGQGAFCAKKVGEGCCVGTPIGQGFCALPCLA